MCLTSINITKNKTGYRLLPVITVVFSLSACGGGSDGRNNINDPTATSTCETTLRENVFNGKLTATDPNDTLLTYSIPLDDNGTKGTAVITDSTSGTYTYTPNNGVNDWGVDTFSFTVQDIDGGIDTAIVTIIIAPRIMPLGDSITAGVVTNAINPVTPAARVGYRQPLFNALTIPQKSLVDFVGNEKSGSVATPIPIADEDHQGIPGFRDDEVAANIVSFLTANPAEFILLHIGTNNFSDDEADVANILANIDNYESTTGKQITVLLAKIIDTIDKSLAISSFNSKVVAMTKARQNTGDNIILVDQFAGAGIIYTIGNSNSDMSDNLHPNTSGYAKMASIWFNALNPLIPKCP